MLSCKSYPNIDGGVPIQHTVDGKFKAYAACCMQESINKRFWLTNNKLNNSILDKDCFTTSTSGIIFSPRNGHSATVYNNKTWIIGGRTNSGFGNDIWYSSNMIEWTKYEGALVEDDLRQHSALHYNDAIWLFGGYNDSGITGQILSIKED